MNPITAGVSGRINAIKPDYYTRMGTAIRHASGLLADQPAGRRIPAAPVRQRRLCGHSPPLTVAAGIAIAIRPFDHLNITLKNAGCLSKCLIIRVPDFLFRVDPDQLVACQSGLR